MQCTVLYFMHLLILLIEVIAQEKVCKDKNQVYDSCGTNCPSRCENGKVIKPNACNDACKVGCRCRDNLFLDIDGSCLTEKECFEKYVICTDPNSEARLDKACPPRCNPGDVYQKQLCNGTKFDCFCKTGYILNHMNVCVPVEDCGSCGKNQYYSNCGRCIPPCVDGRVQTDIECLAVCRSGCYCHIGYVLKDGSCITPQECEGCKGENQHYDSCGKCLPHCNNGKYNGLHYNNDKNGSLGACLCSEDCICTSGYIMNNGKCISIKECQGTPNCPENEHYDNCGPACSTRCMNGSLLLAKCIFKCTPKCFCNEGFVRNDDGKCIPITRCRLSANV